MKKFLWQLCFFLVAAVFIGSSAAFVYKLAGKNKDAGANVEIRESFWGSTVKPDETKNSASTDANSEGDGEPLPYIPPEGLVSLAAENPNVIGWIYVPDTDIDYPIVQNRDDYEYYLKRDINGNRNSAGSIFIDSIDDINADGMHLLYGHHMKAGFKGGTMFRDVSKYNDPVFMESHPDVYVYTLEKGYHLKPLYCYNTKPDISYREAVLYKYDVKEFIKEKIGVDLSSNDVFVLITCDYTQKDARTYLICEQIG